MSEHSTWLRPRTFVLAVFAWWTFWFAVSMVGGLGVWVDGVQMPLFSRQVLLLLTVQAVPLGLATPILLQLGANFAASSRRGSWWRPALWVLVCAGSHGVVYSLHQGWPEGSWRVVAMSSFSWGLPYAVITAVGIALGEQRVASWRERELLAAQLRVLRGQLQPHFLFNSLQAIASAARQDADVTVRMLALLGDLLRQTLCERQGHLVPLTEERDLLSPYLELQRLRFGDRLTITVDLAPETLDAQLPDLLLQPLVENALCHGIERVPGPGTVVIRSRRDGDVLELQVADDGAGPDGGAGEGVGLGATRARLVALFGDQAMLRLAAGPVRGSVVTLRLPFSVVARAA